MVITPKSYEAYLATGGKESDYRSVNIQMDYEVRYNTEGVVSLGIYKTETIGSAFNKILEEKLKEKGIEEIEET